METVDFPAAAQRGPFAPFRQSLESGSLMSPRRHADAATAVAKRR